MQGSRAHAALDSLISKECKNATAASAATQQQQQDKKKRERSTHSVTHTQSRSLLFPRSMVEQLRSDQIIKQNDAVTPENGLCISSRQERESAVAAAKRGVKE